MIIEEFFEQNEKEVVKTYSNENKYIIQETGVKYASAVDIVGLHTYTESDELIPVVDNEIDTSLLQDNY